MSDFQLFPDSASTIAGDIDAVFFALLALSILFGLGVAFMVTFLAIRYRQGADVDRSNPSSGSTALELTWSILPLILGLGIFAWGADVYFNLYRIPDNAIEISAIGKQWMWKFQHPNGHREINDMHIPVGTPIKMNMISQDVIHSLFIPAFRIKRDALPGTYTTVWFQATKTGTFHLFCTEYCGLDHAVMGGKVIVMEPAEYEQWLAGTAGTPAVMTGEQIFEKQACTTCHRLDGTDAVGPSLVGKFGQPELLQDDKTVVVDEQYIRNSILLPNQDIVAGFQPVMPTYQDRLTEEEIMELINYIKSLAQKGE